MNNVIIRTISGIIFIIIMGIGILWNGISFSILFGLLLIAMMDEYFTICLGKRQNRTGKILGFTAGVFFFLIAFLVVGYGVNPKYLLLTILPLTGVFIGNLYIKKYNIHHTAAAEGKEERENNGYELFPFIFSAFFYIVLPVSMLSLIVFNDAGVYSGKILLSMFILLWCTDVGAYCAGSTLGKKYGHKLFFSISPKKSWEGFWGGFLSTIIASIVLHYSGLLNISLVNSIILSVIICVFGVLGDLVESQLKRNFGVKDSGNIMPGHGGMLDRFDGALIAFPVAIIYLMYFAV